PNLFKANETSVWRRLPSRSTVTRTPEKDRFKAKNSALHPLRPCGIVRAAEIDKGHRACAAVAQG
ncbi:MAG: hypothetical protein ACKVKT_08640, partial [Rhodospirillales bacterium]